MKKELKFEAALQRLEEIVSLLEQGNTPLEEAIKIFEEGMELAKLCSMQLNEAEKKLQKLVKSDSGFQLELLEPEQ